MQQLKTGLKKIGSGIATLIHLEKIKGSVKRGGALYTQSEGLNKIADGVKHIFGVTKEQKLDRLVEKIIGDVPEKSKDTYRQLVKNQIRAVQQSQAIKSSQSDSYFNAENMGRLAKDVLDGLAVGEFIGVQPMDGPVSIAHSLRFKLSDDDQQENDKGRQMSLEVLKNTVSARSMKLSTSFNLEAAQDLKALHSMNPVDIFKMIAVEIATEINAEIINRMLLVAALGAPVEYDPSELLEIIINRAANNIARGSRRGCGNFVIMDSETLVKLQEQVPLRFVPTAKTDPVFNKKSTGISFVGTLNKTIKVYVAQWLPSNVSAIVGYKGQRDKSAELDAGFTYCPYVLAMPTGVIMNPSTFQPMVSFMTRYGLSSDDDAKNYFAVIRKTTE